jgi:hypothetical protein
MYEVEHPGTNHGREHSFAALVRVTLVPSLPTLVEEEGYRHA